MDNQLSGMTVGVQALELMALGSHTCTTMDQMCSLGWGHCIFLSLGFIIGKGE